MIVDRRDSAAATSTWQDFLLHHTEHDFLSIAEGSRLYYGYKPTYLHWLDQVCLLLVRLAYLRRCSLELGYPVPVCNLPVLAATLLLIHNFVQNYPGKPSLLILSPRTEIRQHHLNLRVRKKVLASVFSPSAHSG